MYSGGENARRSSGIQMLQEHDDMLKKVMNERGFTLIEMLIVLLVISILLIITIPNITKNQSTIQSKGCEAFVKWNNYSTSSLQS